LTTAADTNDDVPWSFLLDYKGFFCIQSSSLSSATYYGPTTAASGLWLELKRASLSYKKVEKERT
jgi:hypothetical protein